MSYGVPQGSVWALPYSIYIFNDLCTIQLLNTIIFVYADDTAERAAKIMAWITKKSLDTKLNKNQLYSFFP